MSVEIERITAEIFDSDAILPQQQVVYRFDIRGERHYYRQSVDPKFWLLSPSVTTIIGKCHPTSPFLRTWWATKGEEKAKAIMKESAAYGTLVHILFGEILRGETINLSATSLLSRIALFLERESIPMWEVNIKDWAGNIRQDLVGFVQWIQDCKVKPIALEYAFVNEEFSGTIDLVAYVMGVLSIIDFKSGRGEFYPDHIVQLAGYLEGWNMEQDQHEALKIYNYGCKDYRLPIGKTVTPYRFKDQTEEYAWRDMWQLYKEMYFAVYHSDKIKYHSIVETSISKDSVVSNMVEEIDPIQMIQQEMERNEEQNKTGVQTESPTDPGKDQGGGSSGAGVSEEPRLF